MVYDSQTQNATIAFPNFLQKSFATFSPVTSLTSRERLVPASVYLSFVLTSVRIA
jgi:hypothetical protein